MQRGNGIGSSFRGLFHFVKPLLYSVGKEPLMTGSNIITDILNKGPEQPMGNVFRNRFNEGKNNLKQKIKKMTGSGLGLKRKRKSKKECLKSGLDIFLKRSIQTSIVNSHTVTYKPIAPADNPPQLEFNCSGQSEYYIYLNSVRLLLRLKIVKTDGSDLSSAEPKNTVGCVNNLLHSMFSSLNVSLNGKPVTLHDTNYHYKVYLEKLLNYGSDTSGTHLVSSFWYLDSSGELKDNTG